MLTSSRLKDCLVGRGLQGVGWEWGREEAEVPAELSDIGSPKECCAAVSNIA